jgi:hypothetical protein
MKAPEPIVRSTAQYIGKCIYCGSEENLTNEHIVPRGLAGPWQLLSASCRNCSKITAAFERDVLREYFILVRTNLGLPTYHRRNRPRSFDFRITKQGVENTITVPVPGCPTLFAMPIFEKPGYIAKRPQNAALLVKGMSLHGSGLEKFKNKYDFNSFSFSATLRTNFARLLAKIAYGMIVDQHGLDAIKEIYVLPSILGKKDDVGYWVGCEHSVQSTALIPKEKYLHSIDVLKNNSEVGARIRLFANFQTPQYLVIVGSLK